MILTDFSIKELLREKGKLVFKANVRFFDNRLFDFSHSQVMSFDYGCVRKNTKAEIYLLPSRWEFEIPAFAGIAAWRLGMRKKTLSLSDFVAKKITP